MFTGIVEEMGVVKAFEPTLAGARLTVLAKTVLGDLAVGASVSVNGACLTAVSVGDGEFAADLSPETLSVTTLGKLAPGAPVNLERAMKVGERLGGHLVSGHVDAVGLVHERRADGNAIVLTVEAPAEVLRYCIVKGSITVDGVSMTVNQVTARTFSLAIIPHTAGATTLGLKNAGDTVNLEADLIGKYVERLLHERGALASPPPPAIDVEYLKKRGLI